MSHKGFTHLHLHSQYSLLDGAITYEKLLKLKDLRIYTCIVSIHCWMEL